MESKPKVLLTGVTGFLGSHVGKFLIDQCPEYDLRCSTRNAKKAEILKTTYPDANIEWVEANLDDSESMDKAISGCTHIIHVASTVPSASDKFSNEQLVKDVVNGMNAILEACLNYKVKKLIVTSSCGTINGNAFKGNNDPNYSEDDFALKDDKKLSGYILSKCLQEDLCIKWLETNKDAEGLTEIVTLHPSFIVGPVLNSLASSSVEGMKKLVNGSIPVVPRLHLPTIDVRDCA